MPPQPVPAATAQPVAGNQKVTYDAAIASLGYLFVTASAKQISVGE